MLGFVCVVVLGFVCVYVGDLYFCGCVCVCVVVLEVVHSLYGETASRSDLCPSDFIIDL